MDPVGAMYIDQSHKLTASEWPDITISLKLCTVRMTRQRTGVTKIGRSRKWSLGVEIFGTGRMEADFDCCVNIDVHIPCVPESEAYQE